MSIAYNVFVTQTAENDLNEIVLYIAQDSANNALAIFEKLQKRISSLASFPEKGRIVSELENHNVLDYRELIESPWRIIYRIKENKVIVLNVIDGRRNIEELLVKHLLK